MHTLTRPSTAASRTPPHASPPARPPAGGVTAEAHAVSPQGIVFSLGGSTADRPSVWLALLLDGQHRPGGDIALVAGDMLCGPERAAAASRDTRFLHVAIPCELLRAAAPAITHLPAARGANGIFAAMLRSVADGLGRLGPEQLRPIEGALIAFVAAHLHATGATRSRGDARAQRLLRVRDAMEARLGDGALSLRGFAREQHASPRTIQKLFGDAGSSFSGHLRQRRLERCHADLASRAHEALSIADIAFRWGFNDAAHFSRAFRDRFGTTPRAFRSAALASAGRG